jgi:hypothetical protein
MATLTWKNVTGDEINAGASSLKQAGSLFSKAFENFSGAVEGRNKRITKENTESALNQIRAAGNRQDLEAVSGTFGDLDALKEQAGGYLDTSAISKALAGKGKEIQQEEQAQVQRDRATTLFGQKQTAYQQQQKLRADEIAAADLLANIETPQQRAQANLDANTKAIELFNQENPDVAGAIALDQTGTLQFDQTRLSDQQLARFGELSEVSGRKEFQSRAEGIEQITQESNLKNLDPRILDDTIAKYTSKRDRNVLDKDQQVQIAAFNQRQESTRNTDVAEAKASRDDRLKAVNPITNDVEKAKDVEDLNSWLLKKFPDGTFSFGIGSQEGGTPLLNQVNEILQDGIKHKGKTLQVEPYMIRKVIGRSADFEDNFLDDSSVTVDDLIEDLKKEASGASGNPVEARRKAIRTQYRSDVNDAEKILKSATDKFKKQVHQQAGVADPTRNVAAFKGIDFLRSR